VGEPNAAGNVRSKLVLVVKLDFGVTADTLVFFLTFKAPLTCVYNNMIFMVLYAKQTKTLRSDEEACDPPLSA
jgi:hypothetical protein